MLVQIQTYTYLLFFLFVKYSIQSDIKGFDDTILFDINWPGSYANLDSDVNAETITVTSSMQEKYKCILPNIIEKEEKKEESYSGPSPLELIVPLFSQGTCSYRLESYWTYEVCHGKYIRQYHEEREGKKVKLQEYILGKWDEADLVNNLRKSKLNRDDLLPDKIIPTKKIDNVNLPYYEVLMDNGTACDLNFNKPRLTKVIYVCYIHGKHEVYHLKETSTCVYEIIILTPLLCTHPKYKPKETGELKINCLPLNGALNQPYNLLKLKKDSAKLRRNSELERIKVELIQFKPDDVDSLNSKTAPQFVSERVVDTTPVRLFLQGKHCLYGGTGWWKFEFCYGKSIEQFHIEKDGSKIAINLGKFNKQKHLDWIERHPHKRPKPVGERKQLTHFYSEGSLCDKTGEPRQTEVKLKCLEKTHNPATVSLYLLEPRYCQYILGVESPLICNILDKADENGLVDIPLDYGEETDIDTFTIKL
ncbi:endoplasmic reticulum lectin 1 [Sitophilus oryzae]|uniref:Endoplasmic reticulum lectin 1 n=1 Tax=Sitophilus oryzae TaxID=7048 RepID=A0A6J2XCK8_SITOR|nr:endoplasmic reticulum lectin 1 [Sitophilus oryzae]